MNSKSLKQQVYPLLVVIVLFGVGSLHAQLSLGEKDDIGFTALQAELGASMPTGSGISVSQIEGQDATNYRPNPASFSGKNFTYGSGGSTGFSGHATTVGGFFYGASSLAPNIGISPKRITVYEAGGFLQSNYLLTTNNSLLPNVESNDIQNHSWIGTFGSVPLDVLATRRMDYAIQRDDFVATFGLNNGSGSSVPTLMAGAYNGIVVGLSNGEHSRGGTSFDGGPRTRPDIVVPTSATSWAAPTVGSAAALLLETSRTTVGLADAAKSVVVKSLLMTGATRNETEFGGAWTNTSSQPLDVVYGAGELNILHSHDLLVAGQQDATNAATVNSTGWDLGSSNATTPQLYFFDLSSPDSTFDVAASLVWNRNVTATDTLPGAGVSYEFTPNLANLDLKLFSASGLILGSELAASMSANDNVELIVANGLSAGRYAWQVTSNTSAVQYGFSWNVEGITAVPEPSASMLAFCSVLFFLRRRR